MAELNKVELLERALLSYVEKYGFTDEAREYFLQNYRNATNGPRGANLTPKT